MNLDKKQCDALLAVIDSGSFEQAAQRLHLTPSAVSQRVRALESGLGSPLVIRGRPCRATPAGMRLMQYLRRAQLLEQDMRAEFDASRAAPLTVPIAVNADSLASWFLPAVASFLMDYQVLLDIIVDDQDHTYSLLEAGLAVGCVSTDPKPMRGCLAEPLGIMRYRCMASPDFKRRWFSDGVTRATMARAPVIVFNRKDNLQADFLQRHFRLPADACPSHYIPSSEPYMQAIRLGIGWGLLPEVQMQALQESGALIDLQAGTPVDVALYWHSWKVQSPRLEKMSKMLLGAARTVLRPLPG